jgi:hypothetical protein
MSKQTSIEWLENQIKNSKYFYKLMEDINSRSTIAQSDIFDQTKQMHKEEIVNAWIATDNELQRLSAEQYYQETYGSSPKTSDN